MIIENEIKLDYKDVLFRPKGSTLKSRQEVDLFRTIYDTDKNYTNFNNLNKKIGFIICSSGLRLGT